MSERFERAMPKSAAFPPQELWLHNPIKDGRLDVVYDPYGLNLVDMDASLNLLLSTIETQESGYQFASAYADPHHGQHDEADYPYLPDAEINPRTFRTLACNQMVLGRVAHAWWHRVFNKPVMASDEGMKIMIDAQLPVSRFYDSVKYANQLAHTNKGEFSYNEFRRQINMRMGFYATMLETLNTVPEEFQIVDTGGLWADKADDVIRIARAFKRHARPRAPLPIVLYGSEGASQSMSEAA